jgi:chromosome segregation ATPase
MQGRLMSERQAAQRAQIQGEIDGLQQQRGELQSQLKALQERRTQLFVQAQSSNAAARGELEQRMSEIDGRSAGLDRRIESLNDRISEAMGRLNNVAEPGRTVNTNAPRIVQQPPVIRIPNIEVAPGRMRTDMRQVGGMMAAEAIILAPRCATDA